MFLFFSVARSQEIGSWERASETAQGQNANNAAGTGGASTGATAVAAAPIAVAPKAPAKSVVAKNGFNPNFGMNMPKMVSAFDTAMYLEMAAA